jgi:hypothetical protein
LSDAFDVDFDSDVDLARVGRTLLSDAFDVDSDSDVDLARVGRTLLSDAFDVDFDSDVDLARVGRTLLSDAFDVDSDSDVDFDREGHGFTGCGKTRFCSCFWVAQRFTAAITATLSMPALAAEGRSIPSIDFFRSLFSRAVKSLKIRPRFSA